MILAAKSELQERVFLQESYCLDQQMERKEDGSLYFMDRIWVPLVGDVRMVILNEAHKSRYFVHPGADKMYHDLRDMYWWPGMKRDIAIYVTQAARDRQKSYAGNNRRNHKFEVGDQVLLRVSPWKGVVRFGKKGKLAPRYVGPFEILERNWPVLKGELPEELVACMTLSVVSKLKKCLAGSEFCKCHGRRLKSIRHSRFVRESVEIMD
ncbi:putative reverse transcriptase domain-containing protein [Tanacetum coccineum]